MAKNNAGEEKYITLKEAAKLSGYAPDYLGQLIRKGKLRGKQIYLNVAWVTTEEALRDYMAKNDINRPLPGWRERSRERLRTWWVANSSSDQNGNWKVLFDTAPLANNDFHTVTADFTTAESGNVQRSALSQSISFYVGSGNVGKSYLADLNHDGRVNLADFSILLFYWGTSTQLADLNGDGKVDLRDFSILLFNWTG